MIAHRDLDDLPNPRPHGDRPAQPALVPLVLAVCGLLVALPTDANDWAEWRGTDRVGIWSETGIVEQLPATLEVKWRVPLNSGYSGPAVADGRVFITDFPVHLAGHWVERHQRPGMPHDELPGAARFDDDRLGVAHLPDHVDRAPHPGGPRIDRWSERSRP